MSDISFYAKVKLSLCFCLFACVCLHVILWTCGGRSSICDYDMFSIFDNLNNMLWQVLRLPLLC